MPHCCQISRLTGCHLQRVGLACSGVSAPGVRPYWVLRRKAGNHCGVFRRRGAGLRDEKPVGLDRVTQFRSANHGPRYSWARASASRLDDQSTDSISQSLQKALPIGIFGAKQRASWKWSYRYLIEIINVEGFFSLFWILFSGFFRSEYLSSPSLETGFKKADSFIVLGCHQLNTIKYHDEGVLGTRLGAEGCLTFHPHLAQLAVGSRDGAVSIKNIRYAHGYQSYFESLLLWDFRDYDFHTDVFLLRFKSTEKLNLKAGAKTKTQN